VQRTTVLVQSIADFLGEPVRGPGARRRRLLGGTRRRHGRHWSGWSDESPRTLARGWKPRFGAGKQNGSWTPVLTATGRQHTPIALYTNGRIELQFNYLKARAPFDNDGIRSELLRRLNEIPGIALAPDTIDKTPSIQLALLSENHASSEQLKRVLEWLEAEANRAA
jgi:hypothetical protein